MSVFLWILVILVTLTVVLPVGVSHFGHHLGMKTHRWNVRQIAARKVIEPTKRFGCWEPVRSRYNSSKFVDCDVRAEAPCGRCWDHCDTCVRTESKKPERQNRALEIEMGMDQ